MKERTYGQSTSSIAVGYTYSPLAWVPESEGSWALLLRHDRLSSFETPVSKAAFQLKQVCRQGLPRPIATYDRAYGNAPFMQATAKIEADLLVRLPSNRCVRGAPPPYAAVLIKGR
ncbi:MAG: hypothetical protein F6K30_04500 [Cyanothece sp. SIO2G6]|nr:hypothetical protein [Cyanothece sp. SIO2G6]